MVKVAHYFFVQTKTAQQATTTNMFSVLAPGTKFKKNKLNLDKDTNDRDNQDSNDRGDTLKDSVKGLEASTLKSNIGIDFFKSFSTSAATGTGQKKGNDKEDRRKPIDSTTNINPTTISEPIQVDCISTNEQASIWRKEHQIKVYGTDIPYPFRTFDELCSKFNLKPFLRKNLAASKYSDPTPIQMQAVPCVLYDREVLACAPTGSGKTLAFLLPILHKLKGPTKEGFRALIITPTRELGQQVLSIMSYLYIL